MSAHGAMPDDSVVTLVVKKQSLDHTLGHSVTRVLLAESSCVVYSRGQDDHLMDKDRFSQFDSRGNLDDADMLAIVLSNIEASANPTPEGADGGLENSAG